MRAFVLRNGRICTTATMIAGAGVVMGASTLLGDAATSVCDEAKVGNEVVGSIVMFRHGARTPVFKLPDGEGAPVDWLGEVLKAPPKHAVDIQIRGGNLWKRSVAFAQATGSEPGRVNAGLGGGQLTNLGWSQGEALGRRLRVIYGPPSLDTLEVVSTDMPRTVETAHAVLTGLMGDKSGAPKSQPAVVIRIEQPSPWVPNTRCVQLADMMKKARETFRESRSGLAAQTQSAIAQAFGDLYDPTAFGVLNVHDDCQARRWHGKPPSPCVDVALCDAASREATREVMTALGAHGHKSWKLSAGPMCYQIAAKIRDILAKSASHDAPHKLMLISAHDTSIFTLLNAINTQYRDNCTSSVRSGVWPPYTSSVTIDVMRDRSIRLLYQFEPLTPDSATTHWWGGGGGQGDGREDANTFLQRLDVLAMDPEQFRVQCPEVYESTGVGGAVFNWGG